ncbi:hypothetical protein, partial [Thiocapsa imhoffii]|uniref:hypothetical protein n=1 Tax=Thiocapsa imhoffii TaxID=382777 RepID=UPI001A932842
PTCGWGGFWLGWWSAEAWVARKRAPTGWGHPDGDDRGHPDGDDLGRSRLAGDGRGTLRWAKRDPVISPPRHASCSSRLAGRTQAGSDLWVGVVLVGVVVC